MYSVLSLLPVLFLTALLQSKTVDFLNFSFHSFFLAHQVGGTILFWPEEDPNCGTGKYVLNSIFLALSALIDNTEVSIDISLFSYYPGLSINESNVYSPSDPLFFGVGEVLPGNLVLIASVVRVLFLRSSSGWVTIPLNSAFIVDVNDTAYSVVTWKTSGQEAFWAEDYTQVSLYVVSDI